MRVRGVMRDKIIVPVEEFDGFDPEDIVKGFSVDSYNDYSCAKCPLVKLRRHKDCIPCEHYKGRAFLAKRQKDSKGRVTHLTFPLGAHAEVERRLSVTLDLRDRRDFSKRELKRPLKLIRPLYDGSPAEDGTSRIDQYAVKDKWLEHYMGVIHASARSGKCVTGDAYVMSAKGFLPIAKLFAEDHPVGGKETRLLVGTRNGNRYTSHTYKKVTHKTIKLDLDQGYTIEGTAEHPVRVIDRNGHMVWRRLDKIQTGDHVQMSAGHVGEWPANNLDPDFAKFLGFLTANACMSPNKSIMRVPFTSGVPTVQAEFLRLLHKVTGKTYEFKQHKDKTPEVNIFGPEWRSIKVRFGLVETLSEGKSIPDCVLRSNREAMLAFLSGYLSCDSHVPARGTAELCTASSELATQLHLLLQAFGVFGQLSRKDSYARNSSNPTIRTYYRLLFSGEGKRRLIDLVQWHKPIAKPNVEARDASGKYLATAIPNLRPALAAVMNNGKFGYFNINSVKVQARIPFATDLRKQVVSRMAFDKADWAKALPVIDHYNPRLGATIRELQERDTLFMEVCSITVTRKRQTVYDLSIPNGREFIANGVVVHNTVLAAAITCEVGMRTLVVTDRIDLLIQFRETFIGGERRVRMTNAKPERVIIVRKMSDFDKPHDVALISYQKMIRETGPALVLKHIKGKYGLLCVDEAHGCAADSYSKFLARLDIPYRLGLSATPRRKDGRYRLTDTILGPVVVRTKNVGLKPLIRVHQTGLYGNMKEKRWYAISKLLAGDDDRNRMITRLVYEMLDKGHKAVIVPLDQVEHIDHIVERINKVASNRVRQNGSGSEVEAIAFYGKTKKRDELLKAFDRDDAPFRVLVCMRSIIKQGVDVSRPSAVVCPIPMSGKNGQGAPLFSQLSYRASTPLNGKRQPEVTLMVDDLPFAARMNESLFRTEIIPQSDLKVGPNNCVYKVDRSCAPYLGNWADKFKQR